MKDPKGMVSILSLSAAISAGLIVFLGSTCLQPAALAQVADETATTACSDATLKGSYGVLASGAFSGQSTYTNLGIFIFNGKGQVTETSSGYNGLSPSYRGTAEGTYKLESNCVGTMIQTWNGKEFTYDIVVVSGGTEIDMMSTSRGLVQTQIAKKI